MCVELSRHLADFLQISDKTQLDPVLKIFNGQDVGQMDSLNPPYDPTFERTNPHDDGIAELVGLSAH